MSSMHYINDSMLTHRLKEQVEGLEQMLTPDIAQGWQLFNPDKLE